ncbi:hypothetical protein VF13_38145, partial [Nostoc linckia z16]
ASTSAQTISGSGTWRNSTTATTASMAGFTVNNTNATGVHLSVEPPEHLHQLKPLVVLEPGETLPLLQQQVWQGLP